MVLEKEMEVFRARLPELAQHEGEYALVHGSEFVGTYATLVDAVDQGYARFAEEPFLVKEIRQIEPLVFA